MSVDEVAKQGQRLNGDAPFGFVGETLTRKGVEHPARNRDLEIVRYANDDGFLSPLTEGPNDLDVLAHERMVAVVDPSDRRNMSSVLMPVVTPLRPICWRPERTSAPCKSCWATAISRRQ